MTELSRDIMERVQRVLEYHDACKRTDESLRSAPKLDWANEPNRYRVFSKLPKVALPTKLLDAPAPALSILSEGTSAVAESQQHPAQDLRTLASWLHLAAGRTLERRVGEKKVWSRACPSAAALFPCEIYVAAFGITDLEPGLYHFSIKEFALRRMREGAETLGTIRRGRPDLDFLKSVPAALLVSTIFWRSAWKYRRRGYRMALLDAGHVVENLVAAGNGLGISTMPRLRVHESSMRELIGLGVDAAFGAAEAVQAMVVWADQSSQAPQSKWTPGQSAPGPAAVKTLPLIEREPLSPGFLPHGSITAVHADCVAPGMVMRAIRPPTTATCAMPPTELGVELPPTEAVVESPSIRQVLLARRSATRFDRARHLTRNTLLIMNRLAFLGGSFHPIFPDGPHLGLVRPFWVIHNITGMDNGIWYYHSPADKWWLMRRGQFRFESNYLCIEQALAGDASAMCWICADFRTLLSEAGPDAYRLGHLEAGIAGQRMSLTAGALGIGCCGIGSFYDEEVRQFINASEGYWEPLYAVALGMTAAVQPPNLLPELQAG